MWWIAIPHASACGMMACDAGPQQTLVVQNAERIAFGIDEATGMVEAHVQIFYEGPPDAFAWIVPVSSEPEVFISNDALFSALQVQLAPTIVLDRQTLGTCKGEGQRLIGGCRSEASLSFRADAPDSNEQGGGVTVVSEAQVGPYDTSVLTATSEDALISWLQDNSYDVPDGLGALLAPYLSGDAHFLAVRLSKDSDSGDIAPLGWRYRGTEPAVPIQLTAVATAPDLGLEVSVFARNRVVPKSYLHVVVNEANLDWFDGGSNYYDLVSRAADQAGGHAFATDYSGGTEFLVGQLWSPQRENALESLYAADTVGDWQQAWAQLGAPDNANTEYALSLHLVPGSPTLRWGERVFATPAFEGVDLAALTVDIEQFIAEPLRRAEALFEHPTVTRLSSSLDADEMTVDPVFVQNADMGEVSNIHTATVVTDCTGKKARGKAPRTLELSDGRVYQLPATSTMLETDSEFWTAKHSDIEALRIEETGESGAPTIIADLTADAAALADGPIKACGCSGNALRGSGMFVVLLGAVLARRRRSVVAEHS